MAAVLDDFGAWLIGKLADSGTRKITSWVLGSEQDRALLAAARAAVQAAAAELCPGSSERAGQAAMVISHVFADPVPVPLASSPATLLETVQTGIAAQLSVLDDADLTGTGQSSADVLGLRGAVAAQKLGSAFVHEVLTRGWHGGPLQPLAAQLNHDATRLQGQLLEGMLGQLIGEIRQLRETGQAAASAATEGPPAAATWTAAPPSATPGAAPGRPVADWVDPFELDVHPAIEAGPGQPGLPPLPSYVRRAHDDLLDAAVTAALAGRSRIVVLVGGSSTGKTRSCWEAVQRHEGLRAGWLLWHPTDTDEVATGLPRIRPHTVLWLNDMQNFLLHCGRELGNRAAARLRGLLTDSSHRPVLILGTLWPRQWEELASQPEDGKPDPWAASRQLLEGCCVPVPAAFTGAEAAALRAAAAHDPRLARATSNAENGQIAQYLAGGPALLERYRFAPPHARALIEAAMDARRLGHSAAIPLSLLETAAPGYLSDHELASLPGDWVEQGLRYTAIRPHDAAGALGQLRPRPGQPAWEQPHYRLADYLEQASHPGRIPSALYDAMIAHADPANLAPLADHARKRGHDRYAAKLYQAAVAAGDTSVLVQLSWILKQAGQIEEALACCQRAVDAGHGGHETLGGLLEQSGRRDEAMAAYREAARKGSVYAANQVTWMLRRSGQVKESMTWLKTRADAGDTYAMEDLAETHEREGQVADALRYYQMAADAHVPLALRKAAGLLRRHGQPGDDIAWLRARAEADRWDYDAQDECVSALEQAGKHDEAVAWLMERDRTSGGAGPVARALSRAGRHDEALAWFQRDARPGSEELGTYLHAAGHTEEALDAYRRAAERGSTYAALQAAYILEKKGQVQEAVDWLREWATAAASPGSRLARPNILDQAARMLDRAGREDEALGICLSVAAEEPGFSLIYPLALDIMERRGQLDDAIPWLLSCAEAGSHPARYHAEQLLRRLGRTEEAERLNRFGVEPGGQIAESLD